MNKIVYDYEADVIYEKHVNKVRAIVINKGRCLVINNAGIYMLPGGKIDKGETEIEALKREIQEESGIEINIDDDKEPYLELETYDKNCYDKKEQKYINKITNTKFYIVYTDKDINEKNKKLTESEKEKGCTAEFLKIYMIPYLVETNESNNSKRKKFDREILVALKEFEDIKEKNNKEK